jgi:hypothetical protein
MRWAPRLVDDVDRLVRQMASGCSGRQFRPPTRSPTPILDAVCGLERPSGPLRISTVSATDGCVESIIWKRRDSALSFSKMPRNSV